MITDGRATSGPDAVALGLADAVAPAEFLDPEAVVDRLAGGESADDLVAAAREAGGEPEAPLLGQTAWTAECYEGEAAGAILERLRGHDAEGAQKAAKLLESRSPLSVNATTDGVVRAPSTLEITTGSPPCQLAMTELVVPRSIPTAVAMTHSFRSVRPVSKRTASSATSTSARTS